MLMVVTFGVVAFVLGAATGTLAEAGLTAGTAVVWGVTAESVCKGAKELAVPNPWIWANDFMGI